MIRELRSLIDEGISVICIKSKRFLFTDFIFVFLAEDEKLQCAFKVRILCELKRFCVISVIFFKISCFLSVLL